MSKSLATLDRFVVALVALAVGFFGVWAIVYYLEANTEFPSYWAHWLSDNVNQRIWRESIDQAWFPWMLVVVAVIAMILGLWLLIANLRPHRITRVKSIGASTNEGDIKFNVADIASAVADELTEIPLVDRVAHSTALDRGRSTMSFTVHADSAANVKTIRSHIDQAERDIREAIGDADIDTIYRIHLNQPVG